MRRYILLMKVKMLKIYFLCKFITFSKPNTNCHKTVSHLTIPPTQKVTFRSMHKHSFRHVKENVKFCQI